jgi:4-diphosphocytidyl-2-C-methyl-D-erythritol kinase
MDQPQTETAYAKINLALHVRARMDDGYHTLETLFAFADFGDSITAVPAAADSLTITGEFAGDLDNGPDNLVLRALNAVRGLLPAGQAPIPPLAITLDKALPVAAGLGGGSADAAAIIRLVQRVYAPTLPTEMLIAGTTELGADVGACILSETRIGTGKGWDLAPITEDDVAGRALLLVNPGVPLATGPVFRGWDGTDRGGLMDGATLAAARAGRNDLEPSAIALVPEIEEVLTTLRAQLPLLSRMSGSGATCFALFDDMRGAVGAAHRIADDQPEWWVAVGTVR